MTHGCFDGQENPVAENSAEELVSKDCCRHPLKSVGPLCAWASCVVQPAMPWLDSCPSAHHTVRARLGLQHMFGHVAEADTGIPLAFELIHAHRSTDAHLAPVSEQAQCCRVPRRCRFACHGVHDDASSRRRIPYTSIYMYVLPPVPAVGCQLCSSSKPCKHWSFRALSFPLPTRSARRSTHIQGNA